jgi:tetratricopeptide (TPR) repeat protein
MRRLLIAAAAILPGMAFAVGSGNDSTPTTTETTTECEEGMVWDADAGKCVAPKESSLTDDALYEAARELAYAGRYDDTLRVLAAMSDPMDDRVLTYKGFVHRNLGDKALAEEYYRAALERNPDNLLARSYMGQGYVTEGRVDEAYAQLLEIRERGGEGSWPEVALRDAIMTGTTTRY